MIKKTLQAAFARVSRALLKTPQAWAQSARSNPLNYASVNTLDPSVLSRAFAAADQGDITHQAALFELVEEQDAHIFGELSKRRRAVTGLGWQLAPKDDATQAELTRIAELADMLSAIDNFEDMQYDLTDAIGKGFVAIEINWTPGEVWLPRPGEDGRAALAWVPQRMFRIPNLGDHAGELHYLADGIPVPLTPGRWIIHEHRAKSGYLEQSALFRVLAWTYAYKAYNVRDMQRFLEMYGLPLRLGKYPAGLGDAERNQLLRAVRNIGHDGAGIVPATMAIEFVEASRGSAVGTFLDVIEYWERKQSIAILGGTLTSQADGKSSTNALGDIHNQVRREIMLHDVRQIEPAINEQLVRPIAAINGMFSSDRMPRFFYQTEESADQEKMVKVLAEAARIGMEIDVDWAHEAMQIPRAGKDAQTLSVVSGQFGEGLATNHSPLSTAFTAALSRISDPSDPDDPMARAVDQLNDDADPEIARWLGTIEAMLEAAGSLEEFREMLLAAWPELSTERLVDAMSQAFIALELRGMAEVQDEAEGA